MTAGVDVGVDQDAAADELLGQLDALPCDVRQRHGHDAPPPADLAIYPQPVMTCGWSWWIISSW